MSQDQHEGLKIAFTQLLYAVVIGRAFFLFELPVFSIANALLAIAIVAIMNDFLLYHFDIQRIENNPHNYILSFVIDAVVLVAWYGSVAAIKSGPVAFFLGLGIFYVATTVWGLVLRRAKRPWASVRSIIRTDLPLAVLWFVLAAVGDRLPWWLAASIGLLIFVVLRLDDWKKVWAGQARG